MTPSPSSYSASLSPSTGFHPTLRLSIPASASAPSPSPSPSSSCSLHTVLALPPSFIADRYQLAQLHREGKLGVYEGGDAGESLVVHGEGDLEGPVWGRGGVAVLVKLRSAQKGKARARADEEPAATELAVPLHLRYPLPVAERSRAAAESSENGPTRNDRSEVDLPWPWVFWACPKRGEAALARTPLEGDDDDDAPRSCAPACLPYSFPSLSAFELHFLSPDASLASGRSSSSSSCPPPLPAPLSVIIPTGVAADLPVVEAVTVAAVWFGFAWLAWTAWRTWAGLRREDQDRATKQAKSH
ncbi:hypothetical protein JCM1841_001710 [Sporobolomyces salmonicolor]